MPLAGLFVDIPSKTRESPCCRWYSLADFEMETETWEESAPFRPFNPPATLDTPSGYIYFAGLTALRGQ
jgi:hypothetical protein